MSRAQDLYDRLVEGGEAEVLSFVDQLITEELFLDYKRSSDNGLGRTLHQNDRTNLGKAISGFGNSEGGVILWGIDCRFDPKRGDVPAGLVRLNDAIRFKSLLEQATTGLTVPPHSGVKHHAVTGGFAVTLVPCGMHAPYQTTLDQSFYIRAGSNFVRAPHAVLAGMFGRRPQPAIKHAFLVSELPTVLERGTIRTQMALMLHNFGRGIARDVFVNFRLKSHPGPNCEIRFMPPDDREIWSGRFAMQQEMHLVTRPSFVLPPEAYIMSVSLEITIRRPLENDFAFEFLCGASEAEPWRFNFARNLGDMNRAAAALLELPPEAIEIPSQSKRFSRLFFEGMLVE